MNFGPLTIQNYQGLTGSLTVLLAVAVVFACIQRGDYVKLLKECAELRERLSAFTHPRRDAHGRFVK